VIPVSKPDLGVQEINAAIRVLESGRLSDGQETSKFQDEFRNFTRTGYCSMVSNGTLALESVLRAYKIGKGDEVIVPPLTFFATIEAVMNVGAKPVFADIREDTWNIVDESIEEKITKKTRAIIPVHIFGNPCEIPWHQTWLSDKFSVIKIIEDCAQAHGSKIRGNSVGKNNGCWSFYATKNMTTGGEGGAITTNDPDVYSFVSKYKNHGMIDRDTHHILGTNGRMSEMEAAIGRVQLSRLEEMNRVRKIQVEYMKDKLKSVSWLKPQRILPNHESCYFWNAFWVDEEKVGYTTKGLVDFLKNFLGIETRYRYTEPLYNQPLFRGEMIEKLPNAEKICGKVIGLPCGTHLKPEELDYIVDNIKKI
jgi:perosamine synthetase